MSRNIGSRLTTASGVWATISNTTKNQRALISADSVAPVTGFATRIGAFCRKLSGSGTSQLYFALYEQLANGAPGMLLARTNAVTAPTATAGANVEAAFTWTNAALGAPATAARLASGQGFLLGVRVFGGSVEFAVPTGGVPTTHHYRTVASGYPTDPFTPDGNEAGDPWGIYLVFDDDRAPSAPGSLSPASGAVLTTTTPTMTGTFVDADSGTPWFDKLKQYQIEVRNAATQALLWSGAAATFAATTAERTAAAFSRVYAGTALVGGGAYEHRSRVADDTLTYGLWSAWTPFSVNALGVVDTATSTPAGKIDTDPAALAWTGKWSQPQAHATDRVQVRVYLAGSVTLLKSGAEVVKAIASSASPGTAFTISAAEAGIGSLPPDAYEFTIRGRDAVSGQWSPESNRVAFTLNAPPTIPSNLQPPSGAVSTSRPLLEFDSVDPDADDVEGVDVNWDVGITPAGGSETVYTTTAYDAARGTVSLQLTATHLPTTGTYTWRARARDISAAFNGLSDWSKTQTLVYATGPVVAITNPTEGQAVSTSTPTTAWTVTGGGTQTKFRPKLYKADALQPFYVPPDDIVSAISLWTPPAGQLKNAGSYDLAITVTDSNTLTGTSLRRRFTVAYTAPVALPGVTVSPYQYAGDPSATAVLVTWPVSTYPPGEAAGYHIYRRVEGEDATAAVLLRAIVSVVQTRWLDDHAPGGLPLVYGVSQLRKVGDTTLESPPVEATIQLDLGWIVLASLSDPTHRIVLGMERADSPADVGGSWSPLGQPVTVWGSPLPIAVKGPGTGPETRTFSGLALLDNQPAGSGTRQAQVAKLRAIVKSEETVSVRDGNEPRMWGQITSWDWTRGKRSYAVDITVEERYVSSGQGA